MFKALVLTESDGAVSSEIKDLDETELPDGDVTVATEYSTLNYKDGMIVNGIGRLVRQFPHVPGVDLAGTVETSDHPEFEAGDKVVCTGWRVGEVHWGGYAQKARLKGDWLVKLPAALTTKQAMAIGTAGLTSMLAVMTLEEHDLTPDRAPVLVTGAAGGVGSVAVAILARLGYQVTASTGRAETHAYLRDLGAAELIDRDELAAAPAKPLDTARWAACIDAVGGTTLARVLAQMQPHGSVAAVGNAAGIKLETTVIPFLLRGINLLGIDSVTCPMGRRLAAWDRLTRDLPMDLLESMVQDAVLADVPRLGGEILKGRVRGRVVVDVNA
jgi:acrylyl-CoA reductase (NADPH)